MRVQSCIVFYCKVHAIVLKSFDPIQQYCRAISRATIKITFESIVHTRLAF